MYASLHASADFTSMGFGPEWGTRQWSDAECEEVIRTRDVERSWERREMGDFAVGFLPSNGKQKYQIEGELKILSGDACTGFLAGAGEITWIGYAGIRDATTTSMPTSERELPHWLEMVELRYGVHPEYWGKGYAKVAAEAVLEWGARERAVRRFIAETEKENERSGRVLEKLGFRESIGTGTGYWMDEGEKEWGLKGEVFMDGINRRRNVENNR